MSRVRLIIGAVLLTLIAGATTSGANAANLLQMLLAGGKQPPPPASTTTTTAAPDPAPPAGDDGLTLKDTGLTKIRLTIDSQAKWVNLTMDGTAIQASNVVSTSGSLRIVSLGPTITVTDAGTAVIDFVLRIPQGATTGLSMCKNYMGPATVSLTRMTDGSKVIDRFTNWNNNAYPPKGECEGKMQRSISRSAFIGPVRWPARVEPRPLVLAHYFPWYDSGNLQQNFGTDQPAWPADTNDQTNVAAAIELAHRSNIDGFVVEYESNSESVRRANYVWDWADKRDDFKVAMQIDLSTIAFLNGNQVSAESLDAAFSQVANKAGRSSQLLTDGEPVVFVYGAEKVDAGTWQAALSRLRASTGLQPYVVADHDNLGAPGLYQFGTWGIRTKAALDAYSQDMLWRYRLQPGLMGTKAPMWAAPVSPGFDDRALNRPQPMYIDRANGQRYEDEWAAAVGSLPDWIVVTTWNEYYEQTHIAPGSTTGYRALDQTTPHAGQFHTTG